MIHLHVTVSAFRHETRVIKEASSALKSGLATRVLVTAIADGGSPEFEHLNSRCTVWRIRLRSKAWRGYLPIQLLKYAELAARVAGYAKANRVQAITVHRLALLPLGVLVSVICRAKLIYDCHELETETFGLTRARQRLARMVENRLIRRADLVFAVSESIAEWYRRRYGLRNVYTVMNCPPYSTPQQSALLHERLGIPRHKKIVLYQGALFAGRGIEALLEAFRRKDDGTHVFVAMGYGPLQKLIQSYAERSANIYHHEAVAPDVLLGFTASASVGLAYIDNPSLNDRYCLPNKLFEYVMAGVPVIVNNAPEMRRFVEDQGVGVVLSKPLDHNSLSAALEDVARLDRTTLRRRLLATAETYCWEAQARVLLDAYRRHLS